MGDASPPPNVVASVLPSVAKYDEYDTRRREYGKLSTLLKGNRETLEMHDMHSIDIGMAFLQVWYMPLEEQTLENEERPEIFIVRPDDDRTDAQVVTDGRAHSRTHRPPCNEISIIDRGTSVVWMRNIVRHRDNDFPAVLRISGRMEWWHDGTLHRDTGYPAVLDTDYIQEWWIDGVQQTSPPPRTKRA